MAVDFNSLTGQLERIYSPRLALRQVSLCDAWPLFKATRNPLFNEYLLWDQPTDDLQLLDRVDSIVESARRGRISALSAVVKDTGEWVSLFRFQPHQVHPALVEMGIWTNDRFWQGGYSLELTRACVDAAFSLSSVSALIAAASPSNRASCKVLERCGLTRTSLVYRSAESNPEVPLQEYMVTRDEWTRTAQEPGFERVPAFGAALVHRPVTAPPTVRGISHTPHAPGSSLIPA